MSEPNQIVMYIHCKTCLRGIPPGKTPRDWARLSVGWTDKGLQVWCDRCDKEVVHIYAETTITEPKQ